MRSDIFLLLIIIITCTFLSAATIKVLDNSNNHPVAAAGVTATYVASLSGVDFSLYDAIYLDEHSGSYLSGYESAIQSAMINDGFSLIAEYTNNTTLAQISTVLGLATSLTNVGTTSSWSNVDETHPILTGVGIEGGAAVNVAALASTTYTKYAYSFTPAGAEVIVKDSNGNPVLIAGTLGQGAYVLLNYEALEGSIQPQIAHNAIFWATTFVKTPEPTSIFLLILAGITILSAKKYRK